MHRPKTALILSLFFAWVACVLFGAPAQAREFSGEKALAFTREAVNDGPRPSGSPAIHQLQEQIGAVLKRTGCQLSFDDFQAATPVGPIAMRNILCKFPGKSGKAIVITGHYDTKRLPRFVGANDGGSSTGFLMELAGALSGTPRFDDVIVVFFDGEEAVNHDWAGTDHTYGSRHLADRWQKDGTLARVKALINVDMIGDKDLDILYDTDSNPALRDLVFDLADSLGYSAHFPRTPNGIEDDHIPFMTLGVQALDLIDFTYGTNNIFWHNGGDTMERLSAQSLQIVGTVVMETIRRLEAKP